MKKKTLKETISNLENLLDLYKLQVHDLRIENKALKKKCSAELWSIKDFLDGIAKNIEKISNDLLAEPGTLRVKIIPIENQCGYPIAGYKAEVTAESHGYGDKDLTISLLRAEVSKLKSLLLQQKVDRNTLSCDDDPTN